MAAVALRGLRRRFVGAERAALAGLDLEVRDGELLVLVGPSGCGKSTALRLVAGLDEPDAGTITIGDRDVTRAPPQDRDVAMVFQGYALYPHMTAAENIAFPLKMRGASKDIRARKVAEIAAMLGLGALLDRRPAELSGGERQRVAMARAIVRSPLVFLFDEPLANLDAALRAELRVELAALVRRLGVTSIYVTHDQTEAMTMADRIAVLDAGVLQQIDTPRALYERPANTFVAGFLGAPAINLVTLERDGATFRGAGGRWPSPSDALPDRVRAAFRPERARLAAAVDDGARPRSGEGAVELPCVVVATEPLGAETHVVVDAGGVTMRAKTAGFDAPPRGGSARLTVDADALLWFDDATGARIDLDAKIEAT
jgi:multiple sugar transport system ATP-binding protein